MSSTHVKGKSQRANGTHYTPRILPLKPKHADPRKPYVTRAQRLARQG